MLRTLTFVFLCFLSTLLSGQSPKPYFLYLYDWGEGGIAAINFKIDHIPKINSVEDGYVFQLFTWCKDGDGNLCQRFQKIDFDGNTLWEYDFSAPDTSFFGTGPVQKNWVIDKKLYSIIRSELTDQDNQEIYQYTVFDTDLGQLDFSALHLASDLALRGLGYFYPYQDSLFIFGQSHEVEYGRNVPAFRIMNRQGTILKYVNAFNYFDNNTTLTTNFKENAEGTFNIITVQRDYFSTNAGFLYAGICGPNGQKMTHYPTGDHTSTQYPREVTFENGHRFLVAGIDTLWDDIFNQSEIFKTYYLKPNGQVLRDSLYDTGDTTYYVIDVLLYSDGDALIVGQTRTNLLPFDNHAELFLMRVNPQGETVWHKKYAPYLFNKPNPKNYIQPWQIQEDSDGGILVVGNINRLIDTISGDWERFGFILKLDKNGCYGADCDGGDILLDTQAPVFIHPLPQVSIYPNPTNARFLLEVSTPDTYDWMLYDTTGRPVSSGSGQGGSPLTVDTQLMTSGAYFLQVRLPVGIVNKQIIITR